MNDRFAFVCLSVCCFILTGLVPQKTSAQQPFPAVQPATQTSNRAFNLGPQVAPASLTTPARVLNGPRFPSSEPQIRIKVNFLLVDNETREAIYGELSKEKIKTQTQRVPEAIESQPLGSEPQLSSSRTILTTSSVTSSILNQDETASVIGRINLSDSSNVAKSPSIILVNGQEGEMNDIVQRPFLVGVPNNQQNIAQVSGESPIVGETVSSNPGDGIQVLNDGTSMRMRALIRDDRRVHLATEVSFSRVLGSTSKRLFGVSDERIATIQVPRHQVETVSVASDLDFGETLLIDPYISKEIKFEVDREVPVLGKIPYLNRTFKNKSMATYDANWMILVQPSKHQTQPTVR